MFTLEVVSKELGGLAGCRSGILQYPHRTFHRVVLAWSEAKAETENKKSLRAAALFLFWLKSKTQKMLIPACSQQL